MASSSPGAALEASWVATSTGSAPAASSAEATWRSRACTAEEGWLARTASRFRSWVKLSISPPSASSSLPMSSWTGSSRVEAGTSRTAASWPTVNRRPIDAATAATLRAAGDMGARRRRMPSRTRSGSRASVSVARPASRLTRCSSRRPESSSRRKNGFPCMPSARASREPSGAAPRTSAAISATAAWSRRPRTVRPAPLRSSSATARPRSLPTSAGRKASTQPTGKEARRAGRARIAALVPPSAHCRSSRQIRIG